MLEKYPETNKLVNLMVTSLVLSPIFYSLYITVFNTKQISNNLLFLDMLILISLLKVYIDQNLNINKENTTVEKNIKPKVTKVIKQHKHLVIPQH